ncbi:hypothetical protein LCGC14_1616820, partial [marine sediment metagenome]
MALQDLLKAFWKLGEVSGTRADSIGSNNLADNNTVTQAVGKIGNAAQFTRSTTEFLSIADNSDLRTGDVDFTVGCWVFLDTKPGGSVAMYIASKWTDGGDQREWGLGWNEGDDLFEFFVSPTGSASLVKVQATTFGTPSVGTFYFIMAWHDSINNTINIQVDNGSVDTVAHTTGVFGGTSDFLIGQLSSSGYFDGRIDAVGWWKKVLTQLERTQAYNDALGFQPPFPPPSTFSKIVEVVTQSCGTFTGFVKEIVLPRFSGEGDNPEAIAKFLDEQAEILEDKYNSQVAREIPCDLCVENGAVIFDCGRCVHFEVAVDADINSISFINCFPGDKVDALFRASKDIEISGWPSDLTCPSCGTALSPIKLAAGTILARPIEFAGGGNPVS